MARLADVCYRTIQTQAGPHAVSAAGPLPSDLRQTLDHTHGRMGPQKLDPAQVTDASVTAGPDEYPILTF